MGFTVLPDADVKTLLHSLTTQDILDIQVSLADALHYYSTSTEVEDNGCCATYQPSRTSLKRKNGSTTMFMPATSNDAMGVKIVTLSEPKRPVFHDSSSASSVSVSSLSIADSNSSSNPSVQTSVSSNLSAASSQTAPTSVSSGSSIENSTTPKGSLTLFHFDGTPSALINAEELTAFRTALASTVLLRKRQNVHDVVVFGAGKQAYWHIRLALLLRGPEIHHLTIINRSFERAQGLVESLFKTKRPGSVELAHPKIVILTSGHSEYDRLLKETVRGASVIFTTTPSLSPLFPASYLTSTTARVKGRYIAAIGSYKPHMIELHPDIIRQAVAPHHGGHHYHKHAKSGGAIIVDSVEACMRDAGEVIQAGLEGREVVELGELIMLKRDAEKRKEEEVRRNSESSTDSGGVHFGGMRSSKGGKHGNDDGGLGEWLKKGNVIFKSVGIGLMDIVVGTELVRLANAKGLGVHVEKF